MYSFFYKRVKYFFLQIIINYVILTHLCKYIFFIKYDPYRVSFLFFFAFAVSFKYNTVQFLYETAILWTSNTVHDKWVVQKIRRIFLSRLVEAKFGDNEVLHTLDNLLKFQ